MDMQAASGDSDGFKLFVGGLPLDCKEDELKMVFSTYGQVNKVHIMAAKEGQTRIAAFVFYTKQESGDDAIAVLNDQYKIRADAEQPIQVRWGQSKDKGAGKGGDWGKGFGGEQKIRGPDGWKLFVGGLPPDCTQEELTSVFSTYGQVNKVHIMPPHQVSGRVAAFVYYVDEKGGEDSIKVLNGIYKIREDADAPIQVKWATEKQDKGCGKGDKGWGGGGYGACGGYGGGYGGKGGGWGGDAGWGKGGNSWQGGGGGGWKGDGWKGGGGGWNDGSAGWGGKGGGKDPWSQGKDMSDTKLFVGNLPEDIADDALSFVFSTYGKVQNVHVMRGKSKSGAACAFVELSSASEADTAILTLNDKYEIKPGAGPIMVKKANGGGAKARPY